MTGKLRVLTARWAALIMHLSVIGNPATPGRTSSANAFRSPAYPLQLSADKTHLVDQSGLPFFVTGEDAFLLLVQLSDAEVEAYLTDRQSRGFNSVWIALIDNTYSAHPPCDLPGNAPFAGPDFTHQNPAYWNRIDRLIETIAAHGMVAWINPGFVGLTPSEGYLSSYRNSSYATLSSFGAWLGQRYKNFPNIVWLIGGDADPADTRLYLKLSVFAESIKRADPGHLMTFEASRFSTKYADGNAPGGGYSSLEAWPRQPAWLDLNWIYQSAPTVRSGVARNYAHQPWLPSLMGEDWYEGDHEMTPLGLRQEGYEAILAGANLGRIFGNAAIWNFNSPNAHVAGSPAWKSQLDSAGSIEHAHLGALFRSREHWLLVPDANGVVPTGNEPSESSTPIAARTRDGKSIIAYLPVGIPVTVDLSKIADPLAKVWWFNPRTAAAELTGIFPSSVSQKFEPPDHNDWVLVIDAAGANLPAPGSAECPR